MRLACRKRPISVSQLEDAADRVEQSLTQSNEAEVSSKAVGLAVMRELSEIDTVAYVRFASVYHEFETVADFAEVVARVQREESLTPFKHLQTELIS
jgi:transcriptional repressor NrdR